jgi:DNA-binding beta-propeller fold protein YncE
LGAALLLLGGCDLTNPSPPKNPVNAVYVCNQAGGTISVINPVDQTVATTVDLADYGFTDAPKPHHVVVEPDGSAWYVSLIGANTILKFSRRNEVEGRVSFQSPGMLSLHPTRPLLYAGHTLSLPDVPPTIAVLNREDMTPLPDLGGVALQVPLDRPHGMKVSPTGEYAYSTNLSTNEIVAIDTETQDIASPVDLPGPQQFYVQLDITADGQTAYVTGDQGNQVQVLDLSSPAAPSHVESVTVDGRPWHPQLSDDGSTLYVGSKATNTLTALDTGTLSTDTFTGRGLATPHGSALSPNGQFLYISNSNVNGSYESASGDDAGTVVVFDTETEAFETVIEVGDEPAGLNTRWQP